MRPGSRLVLTAIAVLPALLWADRPTSALPPIEFSGSRPAKITETPSIPLPDGAPLSNTKADSIIAVISGGERYPETRYDVFDIDLDDDGRPEQIVQIARITQTGGYSRCWWGVYAGGKLDQVLYWAISEEKGRVSKIPIPESLRDRADSLSFTQNVPEFFPAVDIVKYGDLTGDGRSEIVVWLVGRASRQTLAAGVVVPIVLSPTPEGYRQVWRTQASFIRCSLPQPDEPIRSYAQFFKIHSRLRRAGGPLDLLLEPVASSVSSDSLCKLIFLDERMIPHDPDQWMPPKPLAATAPIPRDWYISRWEGDHYGGLWSVLDVKLD